MPELSVGEMSGPKSSATLANAHPPSEPDSSPANGEHSTIPLKPPSTSVPSSNELTNGLKRPLHDKSRNSEKIKKVRLTENKNSKDHIYLSSNCNEENTNTSVEISDQIKESDKPNINTSDGVKSLSSSSIGSNVSSNVQQKNSSNQKVICKEFNINKSINTSNILNKCVPLQNKKQSESEKLINKINSQLSDNLVYVEINQSKMAVRHVGRRGKRGGRGRGNGNGSKTYNTGPSTSSTTNGLQPIECMISTNVITNGLRPIEYMPSTSSTTNGLQPIECMPGTSISTNGSESDMYTLSSSRSCSTSTDNLKDTGTNYDIDDLLDDNNSDLEMIDSGSDDTSTSPDKLIDENVISEVRSKAEIDQNNFPHLLALFNRNKLSFEQFESFMTQKILEYLTEHLDRGVQRSELDVISKRETSWRSRFEYLATKFRELQKVVELHKEELKVNAYARPPVITRTVGLQVSLCPRNDEGNVRLPKILLPKQLNNELIQINSEDSDIDEDCIAIDPKELYHPQPACSKSTQSVTPSKLLVSTLSTHPTSTHPKQKTVIAANNVSSASPLKSNDESVKVVDLTDGSDEVNDEPCKKLKTVTENPNLSGSQGSSTTQLPRQVTTHVAKNGVTNKLSMSTSTTPSLIAATSTTVGSAQLVKTPTKDTDGNTSLKPCLLRVAPTSKVLQSIQPEPEIQLHPEVEVQAEPELQPQSQPQIQPQPQRQPRPQSQSRPQSQPPRLRPLLPQPVPGPETLASQSPRPQINQTLDPVPAAIPLANHPAPLPEPPKQKTDMTSLKIPPAPLMNAEISEKKALLLTWNLAMNKTVASISGYHLFTYHETANEPIPRTEMWTQIGELNALALPMACLLTELIPDETYHFAVRAVDCYNRIGPFSKPKTITMKSEKLTEK